MKFTLPDIRHNKAGFDALTNFYAEAEHYGESRKIEIDMKSAYVFDAGMHAVLGALRYSLKCKKHHDIRFINLQPQVKEVFSKTGFYDLPEKPSDTRNTLMPYRKFGDKDQKSFKDYVAKDFESFINNQVSEKHRNCLRDVRQSIFEIFNNAKEHSKSEFGFGVFACGQFFLKKSRLVLTMADLGIGIRESVSRSIESEKDISALRAIEWVTVDGHTTRDEDITKPRGGQGLTQLFEFTKKHKGYIQIVSDTGYWRKENEKIHKKHLSYRFPGTVVGIEANPDFKTI